MESTTLPIVAQPARARVPFLSIAELTRGCDLRDFGNLDFDLQGWNSDHSIFDRLCAEIQPKVIVEVGTWKGRSAVHFAQAAPGANVICVDTWLGGVDHALSKLPQDDRKLDRFEIPRLYEQFLRNLFNRPEGDRIYPIRQTSVNAARILAHHGVNADLIYIDGSHEYEDAYADLGAYQPLLAAGGRMFGDDFRAPGVFAAVVRFAHEQGKRIQEIDNNFWILR